MNLRWTKKKPKLNKECLLITAQNWGKEQGWSYTAFSIEKVECDGRWYLGIITSDGDEWGDIDDLKADKYLVLPLLKPLTNNPTGNNPYEFINN
jgi:hypothetical protein